MLENSNRALILGRAIKNVATTIANVIQCIAHLMFGVTKAAFILAKGVALSVAALFFETGVSTAVSGAAKSIFILEESLAASLDALIGGALSFFKSDADNEHKSAAKLELDNPNDTNRAFGESSDPEQQKQTHIMRDGMHSINECVAQVGNYMLSCYESHKKALLGNTSWTKEPEVNNQSEPLRRLSDFCI